MPVKDGIKQWLVEHGAWTLFHRRRDEHKAAGDLPIVAQRKALEEFYHPDDELAVATAGESSGGGN